MQPATWLILFVILQLSPLESRGQRVRTIGGLIISKVDQTTLSGFTVSEIDKPDNVSYTDSTGKFELQVPIKDVVFVVLRGIHYTKYVKYGSDSDFKTIEVYESPEKLKRENRKVLRELKKLKKSSK